MRCGWRCGWRGRGGCHRREEGVRGDDYCYVRPRCRGRCRGGGGGGGSSGRRRPYVRVIIDRMCRRGVSRYTYTNTHTTIGTWRLYELTGPAFHGVIVRPDLPALSRLPQRGEAPSQTARLNLDLYRWVCFIVGIGGEGGRRGRQGGTEVIGILNLMHR